MPPGRAFRLSKEKMMTFVFGPFDEETRKKMEEERQRIDMQHEATRHDLMEVFLNLPPEQLMALRGVFDHTTDGERNLGSFLSGIISATMHFRFGYCMFCGVDHEAEMMKKLAESVAVEKPGTSTPPSKTEQTEPDLELNAAIARVMSLQYDFEHPTDDELIAIGSLHGMPPDRTNARVTALMDEYELDDAYDAESKSFLGFVCKNCGALYSSLQDRLLKPAGRENCPGCIHKTKWG